jgi:hypothetical protein
MDMDPGHRTLAIVRKSGNHVTIQLVQCLCGYP